MTYWGGERSWTIIGPFFDKTKLFFMKKKLFFIDSEQFVYEVPEKTAIEKNNQSSGFYRQKCTKIMFLEQKKDV